MSADERRVEEIRWKLAYGVESPFTVWEMADWILASCDLLAHIDALTARLAAAERDLKRANEANANLAIQVLGKQRDLEAVRNDLADALDLKAGHGPTALSMLAAERDSLRAQYEQAHAALQDIADEGEGVSYIFARATLARLTPPPTPGGQGTE